MNMKAQTQKFYDALKARDYAPLQELANKAGYTEKFNPLETQFMLENYDRKLIYWKSNSPPILYDHSAKSESTVMQKYGTMLKEDWKRRYTDLFTLVRKSGDRKKFIDCWQIGDSSKIALSKGTFPKKGDKKYYNESDDETSQVLYLSTVRDKYPPITAWETVVGDDLPAFAGKRSLDLSFGLGAYASFENIYATAAAVVLFEFGFYKLIDVIQGKSALSRLGIETDKDAIDGLIAESAAWSL